MSVTAQEIYALPVVYASTCVYEIDEEHLPDLGGVLWDIPDGANTRVEVRVHVDLDYDGRRCWKLTSYWLDDTPVLVGQNGGREGRDHRAHFITDLPAYTAMIAYLASLRAAAETRDNDDVIDPTVPLAELSDFYGSTLEQALIQQAQQDAARRAR